eukprot:TRINITY_DN1516_c0_g1_i1.p1 TRINITY_DN1516_c0_g1~~TRINITY_DN1516_c0_g1_i1.p1  ORF type:complete len:215 (+),score=37.68 TRINITY_DN1516_c0_g1_i1:115-759(+)
MALDLCFSVSPRTSFIYDSPARGFYSSTGRGSNLVSQSSHVLSIPSSVNYQSLYSTATAAFSRRFTVTLRKEFFTVPRCTGSSSPDGSQDDSKSPSDQTKVPFGYTRKDVLLIGLGVTAIGVGLKSGLEFVGVDPLQAGNVIQLVLVLGLTVGWISTYIFRVSNKDMTYAKQLRDYEIKVMEKRLEGLTEAELEALLEQVEEEKRQLASGEQVK